MSDASPIRLPRIEPARDPAPRLTTLEAFDAQVAKLCFVHERADGLRELIGQTEPARGVYIAASQIARFEVLPLDAGDTIEE